jgi:hypothetical protein
VVGWWWEDALQAGGGDVASPNGVQVQPVVDPTKIFGALTAVGFIAGMLLRMQCASRNLETE